VDELFAGGRIVDLILALVALEALVLVVWRARTGGGLAAIDLLPNLAAGASLLAALRLALGDAAWHWIALCLVAALVMHLIDLARRWRP